MNLKKSNRKLIILFMCILLTLIRSIRVNAANKKIQEARNGVVRVISITEERNTEFYYSSGTGFAIGKEGEAVSYFVTNNHVICEAPENVYILLEDLYTGMIKAEVVLAYESPDLAILKIATPITERVALPLVSSSTMDVTDEVYALGFPGISDDANDDGERCPSNIDNITVTQGSITKKETYLNATKCFQIDAITNQGNSGGPLMNENGEVIGINTYSALNEIGSAAEGTNYSIYADYVMNVCDEYHIGYYTASSEDLFPKEEDSQVPEAISPEITPHIPTVTDLPIENDLSYEEDDIDGLKREDTDSEMIISKGETMVIYLSLVAFFFLIIVIVNLIVKNTRKSKTKDQTLMNQPVGRMPNSMINQRPCCIKGVGGYFNGATFPLQSSLRIGTDTNQCNIIFPVNMPGISAIHCEVRLSGGIVELIDKGSTYGTYLMTGQKLVENVPFSLKVGDRFYLGSEANQFIVGPSYSNPSLINKDDSAKRRQKLALIISLSSIFVILCVYLGILAANIVQKVYREKRLQTFMAKEEDDDSFSNIEEIPSIPSTEPSNEVITPPNELITPKIVPEDETNDQSVLVPSFTLGEYTLSGFSKREILDCFMATIQGMFRATNDELIKWNEPIFYHVYVCDHLYDIHQSRCDALALTFDELSMHVSGFPQAYYSDDESVINFRIWITDGESEMQELFPDMNVENQIYVEEGEHYTDNFEAASERIAVYNDVTITDKQNESILIKSVLAQIIGRLEDETKTLGTGLLDGDWYGECSELSTLDLFITQLFYDDRIQAGMKEANVRKIASQILDEAFTQVSGDEISEYEDPTAPSNEEVLPYYQGDSADYYDHSIAGTINIYSWYEDYLLEYFAQAVEEVYPNVDINFVFYDWLEYGDRILLDIVSGTNIDMIACTFDESGMSFGDRSMEELLNCGFNPVDLSNLSTVKKTSSKIFERTVYNGEIVMYPMNYYIGYGISEYSDNVEVCKAILNEYNDITSELSLKVEELINASNDN